MTLNFGNNLFPPRQEILQSFDFRDVARGQGYLTFYGGFAETTLEDIQEYPTGDDEDISIGSGAIANKLVAQTFTLTSEAWITGFTIKGNDNTADFTAGIKAVDGDNKPTGEYLASGNLSLPGDGVLEPCNFSSILKLDAGTYAIVIPGPGGGSIRNIRADGSSPTYTGGNVLTTDDLGASWTADTTKDLVFEVKGYATNPYLLFPNTFDSTNKTTSNIIENVTSGFEKRIDTDFDLTIGVTITLKGTAMIELTDSSEDEHYIIAKLRKWDGTTETDIATGQSSTTSARSRRAIHLNISSNTILKKGDILRLTIEGWKKDEAATPAITLYHDPTTRSRFAVNYNLPSEEDELFEYGEKTDLIANIPFVINI